MEKRFLTELGVQIARLRKRKGLTQSDLAEATQVEPETISRFERGSAAPSLQRLIDIANALEVGVQDLMSPSSPLQKDKLLILEQEMDRLTPGDQRLVLDVAMKVAQRLAESR